MVVILGGLASLQAMEGGERFFETTMSMHAKKAGAIGS
jgi:hypothetical protein